MGNGNKISKDKIGTLKGWIVDDNANSTTKIELGSVTVSSGAKFNLLSLTALMRLGWQLHGNKTSLILRKGNKQIKFQHQIKTEKGLLFVLRIKRDVKDVKDENICALIRTAEIIDIKKNLENRKVEISGNTY